MYYALPFIPKATGSSPLRKGGLGGEKPDLRRLLGGLTNPLSEFPLWEQSQSPARLWGAPKMSANSSTMSQLFWQGPVCVGWKRDLEGAVYHLANCFLLLGFMGGSGVYGCFYLFGFLGTGYVCYVMWGWLDACGLDLILWSFLLATACLLQLAYLIHRLRRRALPEEFDVLYKTLYLPLQVPLQVYKEIVHCCEEQVLTLATEQTYAVEGETPINRLSLLLSGR